MAGSNPFLEGLRIKLARMQAGEEPNDKMSTSIILGMIKALEKADEVAAKTAARAAPPPPPPAPPPVIQPVIVEVEDEDEPFFVQAPIRLCLFDLDNTLIRTGDLEAYRGQANLRNTSAQYTQALLGAYGAYGNRHIYSPEHHQELRHTYPQMKWGVFTRSPKHYATTLLQAAYPGLHWDIVVGREDVQNTKPAPDGVRLAMARCGIQDTREVAIVGDDKSDVVAAYFSGCWIILDRSDWDHPWDSSRYWAMERLPDVLIDDPSELVRVLERPSGYWPDLEYREFGEIGIRKRRWDWQNHFFPRPDTGRAKISMLGRLFGNYAQLQPRAAWHGLTQQVLALKDAQEFPESWVGSLRDYLLYHNAAGEETRIVTVIPFKPGRTPRLERLLAQLERAERAEPYHEGQSYEFVPDLLMFTEGAASSHGQHLTREQRFANVGEHLHVNRPDLVQGRHIVVIDDVVTTGASLLWADRKLRQTGARSVNCVSMTKAVGIG